MTARSNKEFRMLMAPWSVAMLAAFSLPVVTTLAHWMGYRYVGWLILEWFEPLAAVCLFVACLAMAAMSFGAEIHHRTMGWMLVQPVRRSHIWRSKMLMLAGAYISVGMAFAAGECLADAVWGGGFLAWNGGSGLLAFAMLLAGVLCSSAFWTLQSGSIIGGMALPLAAQALLAGVIACLATGASMALPEKLESGLFPALAAGALVYCVLFAYLGWRKFSRLEWRDGMIGGSVIAGLRTHRVKASQPAAPRGPWANLLRKELRLHQPVFYLAMLFVVCWFAALGLKALRPAWEIQLDKVLEVILLIYLPLVWLLSGSISLGEEKQMGAWGWHLTLPMSRARQWTVKISFALLIALILGFLIPALALFAARDFRIVKPELGLAGASPVLLILTAAVFGAVLSFWSATMFGSVVRAALFALMGAGIFLFGGGMMLSIGSATRFFQGLCRRAMVEFQLPPFGFISNKIIAAGWFIGLFLLLVLLLRQSFVHCRHEPSRGVLVKCSFILVISLLLPLWLSSDIAYSFWSPAIISLRDNLGKAIRNLPASVKEEAIEKTKPVSIEEIDRTGRLYPETRRWLRGASIRIDQPFTHSPQSRPLAWVAVTFPNGRYFETTIPW